MDLLQKHIPERHSLINCILSFCCGMKLFFFVMGAQYQPVEQHCFYFLPGVATSTAPCYNIYKSCGFSPPGENVGGFLGSYRIFLWIKLASVKVLMSRYYIL